MQIDSGILRTMHSFRQLQIPYQGSLSISYSFNIFDTFWCVCRPIRDFGRYAHLLLKRVWQGFKGVKADKFRSIRDQTSTLTLSNCGPSNIFDVRFDELCWMQVDFNKMTALTTLPETLQQLSVNDIDNVTSHLSGWTFTSDSEDNSTKLAATVLKLKVTLNYMPS